MESFSVVPNADGHLNRFVNKLKNKEAFTFIRFSDGETEILRNRYLEIDKGKTVFRGRTFKNTFLQFDSKKFDPSVHQNIRKDLLSSALLRRCNYYKGISTVHNKAYKDKDFMLRLNGGFDEKITFADLFLNSNYQRYKEEVVPLFNNYDKIYVIANYRVKPVGILSKAIHISVPDNFFLSYETSLRFIMEESLRIEKGALVLSSASSLTNIVGYKLFLQRNDITFLDVGTSINYLLSMDNSIRAYQIEKKAKKYRGYEIKW